MMANDNLMSREEVNKNLQMLRQLCDDALNHPDALVRWSKMQDVCEDAPAIILCLLDTMQTTEELATTYTVAVQGVLHAIRGSLGLGENAPIVPPIEELKNKLQAAEAREKCWQEMAKSALLVLTHARDGQSWSPNMVKDFNFAIDGLRAMLPSKPNDRVLLFRAYVPDGVGLLVHPREMFPNEDQAKLIETSERHNGGSFVSLWRIQP